MGLTRQNSKEKPILLCSHGNYTFRANTHRNVIKQRLQKRENKITVFKLATSETRRKHSQVYFCKTFGNVTGDGETNWLVTNSAEVFAKAN